MSKSSDAVKPSEAISGRDEMNLAEFPIALLTNREPEDRKPRVFEGKHGRLTITGSEGPREQGNGLPTASDADVLIGLLQLTKRANNFTNPTVTFTRYELLKLIRWPDDTKSYRRLAASLNRWTGVKLHYEKSWWDNKSRRRVDAIFHILESVFLYDRSSRRESDSPRADLGLDSDLESDLEPLERPVSSFSWNTVFFKSCQAGNLKRLDLDLYFSLESAAAKQLYRFLDKHFYDQAVLSFELRDLAIGHVGLSPTYTIPRIKEKMAPCLEELERVGFIEAAAKEQRYIKTGHGRWNITFRRKTTAMAAEPIPIPIPMAIPIPIARPEHPPELVSPSVADVDSPVIQQLIARGITPATARTLATGFSAEAIAGKVEVFDWLVARKDKRAGKNPPGYLADSIRNDYSPPSGFRAKAEIEAKKRQRRQADQEQIAKQAGALSRAARERQEKAVVDAYLEGLTQQQRDQLEREAVADCGIDPRFFGKVIVRDHVRKILGLPDESFAEKA